MNALDYTMLLPPAVALALSGVNALRNPANRNLGDFLALSAMRTLLLAAVWLECVFLYSLWHHHANLEYWGASVLGGVAAWYSMRAIWKTLR